MKHFQELSVVQRGIEDPVSLIYDMERLNDIYEKITIKLMCGRYLAATLFSLPGESYHTRMERKLRGDFPAGLVFAYPQELVSTFSLSGEKNWRLSHQDEILHLQGACIIWKEKGEWWFRRPGAINNETGLESYLLNFTPKDL